MTMQPLQCRTCGLGVAVEKFSSAHTSIQWLSEAVACPLMSARDHQMADGDCCPELRRSIDLAVEDKSLSESRIELPSGPSIPRMTRGVAS